jgi:hypothetical protein
LPSSPLIAADRESSASLCVARPASMKDVPGTLTGLRGIAYDFRQRSRLWL